MGSKVKQMSDSVLKKLWCVIVWIFLLSGTEALGQLTATEDLIRKEIDRLGGAWVEPAMVEFTGPRFDARQFEMLSHLKTCLLYTSDAADE